MRLLQLKVQISLKTPLIKDTLNISEIKALTREAQAPVAGILGFIGGGKVQTALRALKVLKAQGFEAVGILELLILMPLLGLFNTHSFLESTFASLSLAKKDTFYRLLNNPLVDWRKLLLGFVKHFLSKSQVSGAASPARPRCWVVDDTIGQKTGRRLEGIGMLFDHVIHRYVLGFKYLVLGFWDGTSFIPVDFTVHRERGKDKKRPFGLRLKDFRRQFAKTRPDWSPGKARLAELDTDKISAAIRMLKRAGKHGIGADYLLVDSWFVCDNLVKFVAKSKKIGHLMGQCKNDKRKYLYEGVEYSGAALKKLLGAKWTRCRTLKMQYIQVDVDYKGTALRLYFTRRHGNTSERLLLTTDHSLSFTKAFEIYAIRWTIEVYFKESKQLLGLGSCQSRDFDAQIAAATICMMQYITLAHQKRIGSYQTIGGLFKECGRQATEALLSERILCVMRQLLEQVELVFNIDIDETMQKFLSNDQFNRRLAAMLYALANVDDPANSKGIIYDKSA